MFCAKHFLAALHAGQKFLGGNRKIAKRLFSGCTVVAHAAFGFGVFFSKIGQQGDAAAVTGFSHSDQGAEMHNGGTFFFIRFLVDEVFDFMNIAVAEQ